MGVCSCTVISTAAGHNFNRTAARRTEASAQAVEVPCVLAAPKKDFFVFPGLSQYSRLKGEGSTKAPFARPQGFFSLHLVFALTA